MSGMRLTTAGESHGPYEICVLDGIPAGLSLTAATVDADLARRQGGYGRGGRMAIEKDRCEFAAGVRLGLTIGSPIAMLVQNKDHQNWIGVMGAAPSEEEGYAPSSPGVPRPGHADYAGMLKYGYSELRPILERASARETVARVAAGSICKCLLKRVGVSVKARVTAIGDVGASAGKTDYARPESVDWASAEDSLVGCDDPAASGAMCEAVDAAKAQGESLGGVFEVWAWGICPGLGDHTCFDRRIDGRLFGAIGSIPAIKGVELGRAFSDAGRPGSEVHDAFVLGEKGGAKAVSRPTNRAGGIEGGMTNGMPVILRAAMKPIPTLTTPLGSVDLTDLSEAPAHCERSDVTAVPAARVVGEAMVALVLADAYLEKFGGDSVDEFTARVAAYCADLEERGLWRRS